MKHIKEMNLLLDNYGYSDRERFVQDMNEIIQRDRRRLLVKLLRARERRAQNQYFNEPLSSERERFYNLTEWCRRVADEIEDLK